MKERYKLIVDVNMILRRNGRVFLMRRANTGYEDGKWATIGGHLENGESVSACAIREIYEETGIKVTAEQITMTHVLHKKITPDSRVSFFFTVTDFESEPVNTEPDKCSEIGWFPEDELPELMVPYMKRGVECSIKEVTYSELDW